MATLSDLVRSRRQAGQGIGQSLGLSLKDLLREKIDPRRFLNQMGLLVSLFPSLRSFKAEKYKKIDSPINITPESSLDTKQLQSIEISSNISAKNSLILPSMARDMFLIKENIAKIVKLKGVDPKRSDKEWFIRQSARETAYERQFGQSGNEIKIVEKEKKKTENKTSGLTKLLTLGGLTAGLMMMSGGAFASINRTPSSPSSTTGSGFTFNQLSREEQDRLLEAQFVQEGKNVSGSIVNRLNNPGAMKFSKWQEQFGATKDSTGFAKFPSMEQGRSAQRQLWEKTYGDMPIESAVVKWTKGMNATPDATTERYTSALVGSVQGTSPSKIGNVTSGFGMRVHPIYGDMRMHKGVDISAPTGTSVVSVKDGTISKVSNDLNGYGNYILVSHDENTQTRYAHLNTVNVSVGQKITAGQQIGTVGSTGRSTGPHLHYEVIRNGNPVNPNTLSGALDPVSGTPTQMASSNPTFESTRTSSPVSATAGGLENLIKLSEFIKVQNEKVVRDKDVVLRETKYFEQGQNTPTSSGDNKQDEINSKFVLGRVMS